MKELKKRDIEKLKNIPLDFSVLEKFILMSYDFYGMYYFKLEHENFIKTFGDFCSDFLFRRPSNKEILDLVKPMKITNLITRSLYNGRDLYAFMGYSKKHFEFYIFSFSEMGSYIFSDFSKEDLIIGLYASLNNENQGDPFQKYANEQVLKVSTIDDVFIMKIKFDFFYVYSSICSSMNRLLNARKFIEVIKELKGKSFQFSVGDKKSFLNIESTPEDENGDFIFNISVEAQ